MAIALTVLFTAVIGGMAVALGVYLGRKLTRGGSRGLGVAELTPEQVRMKRRVLGVLGLYLVTLLVVGG